MKGLTRFGCVLAVGVFVLSAVSSADTYIVDPNGFADFTTIQSAINDASVGASDIIQVVEGEYNEIIDFSGKAITITSADPQSKTVVANTIIGDVLPDTITGNVVTFTTSETAASVLAGFTISGGTGRGISCNHTTPTITNCVIKDNASVGMYQCDGLVQDCIIRNNSAGLSACNGEFIGCVISNNNSYGLYNCECDIDNSVISRNGNDGIRAKVTVITNCTIVNNAGDGVYDSYGTSSMFNSIIVDNTDYGVNGDVYLDYNNLWNNVMADYNGATPGANDISADPLFADVVADDYHLKSEAGRWAGFNSWVTDDVTSPCIDAGDPASDRSNEPAPNGDLINQGAYGNTDQASRSTSGAYCLEFIPGDVNFDCVVNFTDLAIMAGNWLECNLSDPGQCP